MYYRVFPCFRCTISSLLFPKEAAGVLLAKKQRDAFGTGLCGHVIVGNEHVISLPV